MVTFQDTIFLILLTISLTSFSVFCFLHFNLALFLSQLKTIFVSVSPLALPLHLSEPPSNLWCLIMSETSQLSLLSVLNQTYVK